MTCDYNEFWKANPSLGKVLDAISACQTKEQANHFKAVYRGLTINADISLGYLTGYMSRDERRRVQDLFNVTHPVFGDGEPTPMEAFIAGLKMGQALKEGKKIDWISKSNPWYVGLAELN